MSQEITLNVKYVDAEDFNNPSVRRTLNWLKKFRDKSVEDLADEAMAYAEKVKNYLSSNELKIDFNNIKLGLEDAPIQKRADITRLAVAIAAIHVKQKDIWPKLRKFKKIFYKKDKPVYKPVSDKLPIKDLIKA